jgi:DNA-binding transcriptional LysR family regulator
MVAGTRSAVRAAAMVNVTMSPMRMRIKVLSA